jgi:hypothetical protein
MAVSVSKDASFSTGAISFRALRLKFKKVSSGAVSLSELKRQTSASLTSPTVPNATENGNIPTTNSNIQLSDYRGSITYYNLNQSGTNTDLNISSQSWNSNLGKNVPKIFYVNGTLGATLTSNYAATFNATAYNLSISIGSDGYILGAGGAGGTTSSPNGKNGGPALRVISTGARINLYGTSRIYAGGGGGGCGATGGTGGKGGQAQAGSGQTGGAGGDGGAGGSGGRGQGYGQSRTNGSGGGGGVGGAAGSGGGGNGGSGGIGGTGGNGGSWGKNGSRGNIGSSGSKGTNAISGLYFRVYSTGTIPFTIYREADRQSTISVPGIADFTMTINDATDTAEYNLDDGYYGTITAFENNPPFTPPSASDWVKIKVSSSSISLDDDQGKKPDGDYQDIVVTSTNTNLGVFGTFSPPAFGVPGRPTNYGSGGNAGTRISGSNYIIRS